MALASRIMLAAILASLALPGSPAHAQLPDKFTNLKVLPKDIHKQELVDVMRSFSDALGVPCSHCHAAEKADPSKLDFDSDAKDAKQIAREMMKMAHQVNTILTERIGSMRPELTQVRCVTCHHGLSEPQTLGQALDKTLALAGPDSAVAQYHYLRDKYYGSAAYDFSEWSLISIAEDLGHDPKQADAALVLLNTNLEYFPESAGTYARIAETYLAKGEREEAMSNFDKALALAPDDPWLKRRVEAVKAGK